MKKTGETEVKEETQPEVVEMKTLEVMRETKTTLQTILGFMSKGMMKLKGSVRGKEVFILIGSGVTHNFIHQGVIKVLNLPLKRAT